ncbi:MAG: LysM peptidoglycan-binding domain-containing protein, partial [Thermoanaerobaculia bacterium]
MRNGWVVVSLCGVLLAGPILAGEMRQASLADGRIVRLEADQEIALLVEPERGDAWTRLALRLTGDASNWRELARLNGMGENLLFGRRVRVPFAMLRPSLQRGAIRALFPGDRPDDGGWRHLIVAGTDAEGETLWRIAEWFTGDGANYARIREANPGQSLSTRRGESVLIPTAILSDAFRDERPVTRIAEDDPVSAPDPVTPSAVQAIAVANQGDIQLEYVRKGVRPYAVYRLQQGEALYSSVAIRFTGRVYAKDVNEVVAQVVEFNGIADVSRIPVDYPVRIPMELLTPEWRPPDDPTRLARERTQRESAELASRVKGTATLENVHVILDAGHGGRDVGTAHEGVWESVYVYDVACRLKATLERRTEARVSVLTRSRSLGCKIPE